ncbi:MAG: hypothetical protein CR974_00475 [Gammaproteobacteria bacterium]|nr:MAG: hypothetical protein CR974_00475 [Gammaproteobacteria bacterium]
MEKMLLSGLLVFSGGMLVFAGLLDNNHVVKIALGVLLWGIAPFAAKGLARLLDPRIAEAEAYHRAKRARKAKEQFVKANHDAIGDAYFKATFLFAGHIAHADGEVCDNELQQFESLCLRLHLDKQQLQLAREFFNQGRQVGFDAAKALDDFWAMCELVQPLHESFLQTQFAFAEANGKVVVAELNILVRISQRLNAGQTYRCLLEEYRDHIAREAQERAEQRRDEFRRQRDKRREAEAKARLEQEQQATGGSGRKKLSPKQKQLRVAFAVLGIAPTKDRSAIKRAYRSQIKRHHPDYLLAQGYPDALLDEATARSAKINRSYDILKEHLGFS